eukprot:5311143-Amphidinium_carterae.1
MDSLRQGHPTDELRQCQYREGWCEGRIAGAVQLYSILMTPAEVMPPDVAALLFFSAMSSLFVSVPHGLLSQVSPTTKLNILLVKSVDKISQSSVCVFDAFRRVLLRSEVEMENEIWRTRMGPTASNSLEGQLEQIERALGKAKFGDAAITLCLCAVGYYMMNSLQPGFLALLLLVGYP